jgi:hypothetical protein
MPSVDRAIHTHWVPSTPNIQSINDSDAPNVHRLLGAATGDVARMVLPDCLDFVGRVSASVRGALSNPRHPLQERDRLLAQDDQSVDLTLKGGGTFRALAASNGRFEINLSPDSFNPKQSRLRISLPREGQENDSIVKAHMHSPDAPVGFYNAEEAKEITDAVKRVLTGAVSSPEASRVNRLRLQTISERVDILSSRVERLHVALEERPELRSLLGVARKSAYGIRKAGDASDESFQCSMTALNTYLKEGAEGLDANLCSTLGRDLKTLEQDRHKWLQYHSNPMQSFYLSR